MKLKFLTLLVAFGLCILGAGVNAAEKQSKDRHVTNEQINAAVNEVNSRIKNGTGDAISVACTGLNMIGGGCSPCNTYADILACVANDPTFAGPIGQVCDKVCGGTTCVLPFIGAKTTEVCKAMCCPLNSGNSEVQACFKSAKTSCSAACNPACKTTESCVDGICVPKCTPQNCQAPKKCVNGLCTAPSGGCTPACKAPQTCVNGKCVAPSKCTPACKAGQVCRQVKGGAYKCCPSQSGPC